MTISPLAGKPARKEMLVDLARLEREYFERRPDLDDPAQLVSFGTSGHRGSSLRGSFTEAHILAITQAICDYRQRARHRRPAVHGQGHARAFRAGAAHGARGAGGQRRADDHPARRRRHADAGHLARDPRVQPRSRAEHLADGIVITPSHNPPEDGGFKYNPTHGGPADIDVTQWIENRANELLRDGERGRTTDGLKEALRRGDDARSRITCCLTSNDLRNVVDMDAIRVAGLKLARRPARRRALCITGSRSTRPTSSTSRS